jgi:peptidoglycan/LPS O-acetylase OafA/YrhL
MTRISVSDTQSAEIPHRNWKRLDGVDVLRGLAILFVVLNHVNMRLVINDIPYAVGFSRPVVASLVWNGQFGIQIFFTVSGFLIISTALRRWGQLSNVSLRDFYLLRVARIVPLLFALLLILIGLHFAGVRPFVVTQEMGGLGRAIFAALTLHVNVLQARHGWLPANWGVLWSLSVEEVFYLFFPLLAKFLGRGKLFVAILLCFVIAGPFARTDGGNCRRLGGAIFFRTGEPRAAPTLERRLTATWQCQRFLRIRRAHNSNACASPRFAPRVDRAPRNWRPA